jgi:hypothetical protein
MYCIHIKQLAYERDIRRYFRDTLYKFYISKIMYIMLREITVFKISSCKIFISVDELPIVTKHEVSIYTVYFCVLGYSTYEADISPLNKQTVLWC